ncbi:MAG TPA: NADH-quinone oxidoreductase subunit C, partial [Bacteroidales bacterium]|nr:NADH-quinone oxidoreductase subunit C [Bacteroidales bacterium]
MNQTMEYFIMKNNPEAVNIRDIPVLDYGGFYDQTTALLKKKGNHVVNYFVHSSPQKLRFYILIANDDSHSIFIFSHAQERSVKSLKSVAAVCYPMHIFEREIHETLGIDFAGHPWMKPVRYPHDRFDAGLSMDTYPFYTIDSEEVHEVGVGPVHAGVIEPGHFRFICHGEKILHLEIQLGYQNRGIENLFSGRRSLLQLSLLSESIAGDTAVGHGLAFSQLAEALSGTVPEKILQVERIVALEMERMAVHTGDTAALCGDVGYQQGQAACEALRTLIINATQEWCGNRFGKGLIRPGGTNYPLSAEMIDSLTRNLEEIKRRFINVTDLIYGNAGILSRFENTGTVSLIQAMKSGAVGMAARATGLNRDVRTSHPFQAY